MPGLILQETAVQPGVSWDPEAVRKGVSGSGGRKAMLAHTEEGLGMHVCGNTEGIMLDHENGLARTGALLLSPCFVYWAL